MTTPYNKLFPEGPTDENVVRAIRAIVNRSTGPTKSRAVNIALSREMPQAKTLDMIAALLLKGR